MAVLYLIDERTRDAILLASDIDEDLIDDLEKEIKELKDEIEDLKAEIESLGR